MSEFTAYLSLGFDHITDLQGYDHMLFLIALCASYPMTKWKNLLILVTAFTIGHSITLALSTLDVLVVSPKLIERLIPITILVTAAMNIWQNNQEKTKVYLRLDYGIALFFGLIHGMGFSNYLRILLGQEASLTKPLFAFNIGLEMGQLIIVAFFVGITFLLTKKLKLRHQSWNIVTSTIVGLAAICLIFTA